MIMDSKMPAVKLPDAKTGINIGLTCVLVSATAYDIKSAEGANISYTITDENGLEKDVEETVLAGTMLTQESVELLTQSEDQGGLGVQDNNVTDCQTKLDKERIEFSTPYELTFDKPPNYKQSYYKLTCRACEDGVLAINSTQRALEIYNIEQAGSAWKNPSMFFGFDAKTLSHKWKQYTVQYSVARTVGQTFASLRFNGRVNVWNVSATTQKVTGLTRDDFDVNYANWTCVGNKINAVITIYYSTVQAASEVSGSVRRPVCGDEGASVTNNGMLARATDVAMNQAVKRLGGTNGGKLKAEWQRTAKAVAFSFKESLAYVPRRRGKIRRASSRAHRRRRSYHRRRRSHRRRSYPARRRFSTRRRR